MTRVGKYVFTAIEQLLDVPVLRELAFAVQVDLAADRALDRFDRGFAQVLTVEHLLAALVDDLALLVHHFVVLEDVLADLEVAVFDGALRALDGLADHLRLERQVVGERRAHHPLHQARREQAHEVVFEREVEAAGAGVALTAGAAAELVVDAAGLVPLGPEDVEAAEVADLVPLDLALLLEAGQELVVAGQVFVGAHHEALADALSAGETFRVAAEQDVDAAARHVRGDRDRRELAGLRDDLGLTLVLLRVQHLVRDALLLEQAGQLLRLLDGDRADEDGLPVAVSLDDVLDGRVVLAVLTLVDEVGTVVAHHRAVGRDRHHLEVVGVRELTGFRRCGAGHAAELVVHPEVVLDA